MSETSSLHRTHMSLLAGLVAKDSKAWRDMVDLYQPLLVVWCRRCGLSEHESDDIVQDVLLSVSKSIDTYQRKEGNGLFRSWLWKVTRNKIIDRHRATVGEPRGEGGSTAARKIHQAIDPTSVPESEPSEPSMLRDLMRRAIEQVRAEFEARTWQAFWRCVVDSVPTDIVAQELGISEAGVRQARSRIKRRLKLQLGDLVQEE